MQVVDGRVARFSVVDDRLNAVQFADGRAIPRAAVFIRPPLRMFDPKLGRSRGCEIAHPDRKAVTGRPSGGFGCKVARDRIACARSFDSVLSTPSAVACASSGSRASRPACSASRSSAWLPERAASSASEAAGSGTPITRSYGDGS